jgi:HSP20 family protein
LLKNLKYKNIPLQYIFKNFIIKELLMFKNKNMGFFNKKLKQAQEIEDEVLEDDEYEDEEELEDDEADEYEDEEGEEEEEDNYDEEEEEDEDEEEEDEEEEAEDDEEEKKWLKAGEEGQLSIDVYQTPKAIVVKSTIAGVKPEDIDISINNDMLTIRGKREMSDVVKEENYLYRECYWGSFSRSIILPVEVQADKIDAILENGVLTVSLPKAKPTKQISVKVKSR